MNRNDTCARAAAMLRVYAESGSATEAGQHVGACATAVYYWLPYLGLDKKWLARVRAMEEKIRRLELGKALRQKHIRIATSVIKNLQSSPKKRSLISTAVVAKFAIPRTAANRIVGLASTAGTCQHAMLADRVLVDAMRAHLRMYPRRGFAMMYRAFLQHQPGTRERARLLYIEHLMSANRAKRKKAPTSPKKKMEIQGRQNAVWSMDFMQDVLGDGRKYWLLNVLDDFNREAILTIALRARSSKAVIEHLNSIFSKGRKPKRIRTDNGSEFTSMMYQAWAKRNAVVPEYSRRSRPTDNAFIESFNRAVRAEVLDRYKFRSVADVQASLENWRSDYNFARPHIGLGGMSPMQYSYSQELK